MPSPNQPNHRWGHCQNCRFFGSPSRAPLGSEEAQCTHSLLAKYDLLVFGAGGCSAFDLRPGLPESVEDPTPRPSATEKQQKQEWGEP